MNLKFLRGIVVASLLLVASLHPAAAQTPEGSKLVELLPARTAFYAEWKGLDSIGGMRGTNPLLRFFDSPEWVKNWEAMRRYDDQIAQIRRAQVQQGNAPSGSESEEDEKPTWEEVRSLLGRRAMVAVVPMSAPAEDGTGEESTLASLFFYDTAGEPKLTGKFMRLHGDEENVEEQTYDFGGTTILETIRTIPVREPMQMPDDGEEGMEGDLEDPSMAEPMEQPSEPKVTRSYRALFGDLAVQSDSKELIERFIRSLRSAPATSLATMENYRKSRAHFENANLFELFVDIRSFAETAAAEAAREGGLPVSPEEALRAFGVGNLESISASVALESTRARFDASLLMQAPEPGTRLILGPPVRDFSSLSFAPPDAISFSAMQFDFGAAWALIEEALLTGLPPDQAPMVMGMKGMAEGMMGMSFQQMADSWGTEFAQVDTSADAEGELSSVHAISLRNRAALVKAVRNLLATFGAGSGITELPAAADGKATHFAYLTGGSPDQEPTVTAMASFEEAWLFLGKSKEGIERLQATADGGKSLRDNRDFQRVRAGMPELLVGLSFVDLERWIAAGAADKLLAEIVKESTTTRIQQETGPATAEEEEPGTASAESELPEPPILRFPRGLLHLLYGSTHRDARGIHLRGTLE